MKAIIKYFLNTFGLIFIVIGLTCDCPETASRLLYWFGLMFYCSACYWSREDEAKQERQVKKLKEKVEELENRSQKKYVKPELNVKNIPTTYEEYLKDKGEW